MTLDAQIQKTAKYWATAEVFSPETHQEILELFKANDEKELVERFYKDLEFGTGGLRGVLGAGTSRMNIYNIRKATTALAQYLREFFKGEKIKVAISYDSRHFSKEFAMAAAEVLAANEIKALITKELRPTPMLSFMVRHFECHAGICVTASHNPPQYNGYKVYWKTGGQVVPPHDKEIIKRYVSINGYEGLDFIPYEKAKAQGLVQEVGEELDQPYFKKVEELSLQKAGRDNLKIVFTPLHGTATYPVMEALSRYGFKDVHIVPEQKHPDGNFPTVKYPNPEEPEALSLAVSLAKKLKADLVLGTDPDCDRIGIVFRKNEELVFLNGNQIGCLLIEYMLSSAKELGRLPPSPLIIKTVVTTELQHQIAEHYGVFCDDTLTGFKWICQLIEDYETGHKKPYRQYVCGGEESYGFLAGSFVRDKDAVTACCLAAEMTAYYKSKGLTLDQVLDNIFKRHGVYQEALHNVVLPGKEGSETIKKIMENLRKHPPKQIDGVDIAKIIDLEFGEELAVTSTGVKKIGTVSLPKSDVLQFLLEDGTKISARPSGTEPKIKFYFSVRERVDKNVSDSTLKELKTKCAQRVERIKELFVKMAR